MLSSIIKIKTILESALGNKFKAYYIGDPVLIPESLLPCISVAPNRTETDFADSERDKHTHLIDVSIIADARQYFNSNPSEMVGMRYLVETMEKENSNGTLDTNSVLYVIRNNLNLETNRWTANIGNIDYKVRVRSEQLITIEAVLHMEIEHIINR